jgi:hypothetical protein
MHGMQCFGCLENDQVHAPEHVIAAALGGELTTLGFCQSCNECFGKNIDGPLAQLHWVQELRHRYGIKDRYGKVPPPPRVPVTVEGEPGVVTMSPEGWKLEVFPQEEIQGDTIRLRVQAEREAEVVPTKLDRLKRKNGEVEVTAREVERTEPVANLTEIWKLRLLGAGDCQDHSRGRLMLGRLGLAEVRARRLHGRSGP